MSEMLFQFMRNKEGGQLFGNRSRVTKVTRPIFEKFVSKLFGDRESYESFHSKYPGAYAWLIQWDGKGPWDIARVDYLPGILARHPKKYAIEVSSFSSREAKDWGSTADSEVGEKRRNNPLLSDMKERARRRWQGLSTADLDASKPAKKAFDESDTIKARARAIFQRKLEEAAKRREKKRMAESVYRAGFDAARSASDRIENEELEIDEPVEARVRRASKLIPKACNDCLSKFAKSEAVLPTLIGEKCSECGRLELDPVVKSKAYGWTTRPNPSLVILSNPERVPGEAAARKAWSHFHLAGARDAKIVRIPDVHGLPKTVVVLGACEGMEWQWHAADHGGKAIKMTRDLKRGPWLVTDIKAKRLWIVASSANQLRNLEDDGFVKAIYYFPPSNSGKHDRQRGYRHEFGEGGRLPRGRWFEVYPKLVWRGTRAVEMVPVGTPFRITERGIVG